MTASPNAAIVVRDLSKRFRLQGGPGQTLKAAILDRLRHRSAARDFYALRHVDFSVAPGETLGIIGSNGAGKSTLLSVVAGTMEPSEGSVETRGKVSSLLELGAGFHPDLTGRENVFLYGAIMGLSRQQMARRFDAIVDFAGIADFIDQPVKHYSSGMYVRLGFAVAVEVDPDILLIDEVLAVGDAAFQRKCLDKMSTFREQGKSMLIISHDLATIQSVSDRILFLDHGEVQGIGRPADVIGDYRSMARKRDTGDLSKEWGTGEVTITDVTFATGEGDPVETFQQGMGLRARIAYEAADAIENPIFGFALSDSQGRLIYGSNTQIDGLAIPRIEGKGAVGLALGDLPMSSGTYLFSFSVHSSDHRQNYHRLDHAFPIDVEADSDFEGCCRIPSSWSLV